MNNEQDIKHETPIQNFYAGQSIFITGCTGFLGQILIEKLLRSCPDISTMYLLIRSKKDKSPESRLNEMFKSSVSIIFHLAANVRFQEKIKSQIQTNICATDTILRIAKLMPYLKSFIYVSTIYANFCVKHIEEHVYTYPINYKDLITLTHILSENTMEEKKAKITSQWPNTYTFTKAIAEGLLRDEGGDLPIGIFRPAIITSTANEPLVGWNNNFLGEIGLTVFISSGFQRFMLCNPYIPANFVPVDLTGNALIASAWDVFIQFRRGKDMLIYNFVPPADAPTIGEWFYKIADITKTYPLPKAQWRPFVIMLQRKMLYRICIWLGHLLPALLVDTISICMNYRPRMWKLYRKIHSRSYEMAPFLTRRWSYSYDNVEAMWNRLNEQDQQLFKFYMKKFDWTNYFVNHYKGVRFFILNEDDSTLEISRIRDKRLYWIHQTFKTLFVFAIVWIIWIIFIKVFT
ncbi:fatty acyl-CoA reductase wat-like isoform X3 [Temnothorax curvispinosus]|uniref:Fatty acyl-CoA reductase n=1 Tax=Temnothorax curvispinosus TaxID=300111 RepID=A0A6J1PF00_9HYME|nr:fatty acyl-CoA reductase wat-like isoform X3 [Temnothorax curvispinosus]